MTEDSLMQTERDNHQFQTQHCARVFVCTLTQIEFFKGILHNCIFYSAKYKFNIFSICGLVSTRCADMYEHEQKEGSLTKIKSNWKINRNERKENVIEYISKLQNLKSILHNAKAAISKALPTQTKFSFNVIQNN